MLDCSCGHTAPAPSFPLEHVQAMAEFLGVGEFTPSVREPEQRWPETALRLALSTEQLPYLDKILQVLRHVA